MLAAAIKGGAGLADLLASAADLVRLALAVELGVPLVSADHATRIFHGQLLDGMRWIDRFGVGSRVGQSGETPPRSGPQRSRAISLEERPRCQFGPDVLVGTVERTTQVAARD
jgi:hypothetical protein